MTSGPTLKTVATAAGVSTATVSNAYNRPDRMSAAVRTRVLAVADELGYTGPDPAAQSLRRRRSGTIGVLFATPLSYAFDDPYCVQLLAGIAQVVEQTDAGMVLMPLPPPGTDGSGVYQAVAAVRQAVVDGVIADGIDSSHPALQLLTARHTPVVTSVDDADGPRVVIDEFEAARALGVHLAACGYRDIAVLLDSKTPPAGRDIEPDMLFPYTRLRLAGLRAGLHPDCTVTAVAAGDNTKDCGHAATAQLLEQHHPSFAIAAVTDVLAVGALAAVRAHGLTPGRDVGVAGFDDLPTSAEANLTTVRQPIREKGRLMARMLLDPGFEQRRILLPTELVVRSSTLRR